MRKFRSGQILGSICMQVRLDIELYLYISGFPMSTKIIMLYMGAFGWMKIFGQIFSLFVKCRFSQIQVWLDSS